MVKLVLNFNTETEMVAFINKHCPERVQGFVIALDKLVTRDASGQYTLQPRREPTVPIRPSWRPAVSGRPLSNQAIVRYAQEGRYGPEKVHMFDPPPKKVRPKATATKPLSWRAKILREYV